MQEIHLARQPIFDLKDRLVGYEILYRSSATENWANGTARQMSVDTLLNALIGLGLQQVTHGRLAFFNVDQDLLLANPFDAFDPERVVIEILESVPCTPETLAAIEGLVQRGFIVALDDFVYAPELEPFLRLASIVKVDVLNRSAMELEAELAPLSKYGARLLAERVETETHRNELREIGFDLFQGYFYAKPEILSGREIPVEHVIALQLMNQLRDPNTTDSELERAFRADLSLTYKLLRIVNSAALGGRGIESIAHALRLLGREPLSRWLALLAISSMASPTGVGSALVHAAMQRARFCELLAETIGVQTGAAQSFMTGLFSHLDALLRAPMEEVLEHVNLAEPVRSALIARGGRYGSALLLIEAYERGDWPEVENRATELGIEAIDLPELYTQALSWAEERVSAAGSGSGAADTAAASLVKR